MFVQVNTWAKTRGDVIHVSMTLYSQFPVHDNDRQQEQRSRQMCADKYYLISNVSQEFLSDFLNNVHNIHYVSQL